MNARDLDDEQIRLDANDQGRMIELAKLIEGQIANGQRIPNLDESVSQLAPHELDELRRAEEAIAFLQQARHGLDAIVTERLQSAELESASLANDSTQVDLDPTAKTAIGIGDRPQAIGRFEVLDVLGEGGFARVFLARDPHLDRLVALKVPLPRALADENSRRRFERESRAAAVLSHPAIVPIFESGSTGPISYIAFAYCPGLNLSEWFAKEQKSIEPRTAAALVSRLAEATEHAHQRGIVHRDLKPANVLLDGDDSKLVSDDSIELARSLADRVRITDFGLARLQSGDDTLTIEGAVVGTPAYMSPEQARGARDVGASSDIYALGTVLYELLTGELPFRKETHLATLRAIENDEPRPPQSINPRLPQDLASVCLKCLRKSPEDRYRSAYELAADLERWLHGIPVQARSASAWEKTVAWKRRNPTLAAVTSVAVLAIVAGLAGTTWQWQAAKKHLATSRAEYSRAEDNLTKALEAAEQEKQARHLAEKVAAILGSSYRSPDPRRDGREIKVVEVLGNSVNEIRAAFPEEHETRWALLQHLGNSYTGLGLLDEAREVLEEIYVEHRELGTEPTHNSIMTAYKLAQVLQNAGDVAAASTLCDEAFEQASGLFGAESGLAHRLRCAQAACLADSGKHDEAIAVYRVSIKGMEEDVDISRTEVLNVKKEMASALRVKKRYEEASSLLVNVIDELEAIVGADHPDTLFAKSEYATCLQYQGRLDDMVDLRKQIFNSTARVMGTEHPQTLMSMSNYAATLTMSGNPAAAVPIFEECIAISGEVFGGDSTTTMMPVYQLGNALFALGQWDDAEIQLTQAYEVLRDEWGMFHARTLAVSSKLQRIFERRREWDRLADSFMQMAEAYVVRDGGESFKSQLNRALAGTAMICAGKIESGLSQTTDCLSRDESSADPLLLRPLTMARLCGRLAAALISQNEFEKAESYANRYSEFVSDPPEQAYAMTNQNTAVQVRRIDEFLSPLYDATIRFSIDKQTPASAAALDRLLSSDFRVKELRAPENQWARIAVNKLIELSRDGSSPIAKYKERLERLLVELQAEA